VLAIAAVPITASLVSDSTSGVGKVGGGDAKQSVLAALDATLSAGSYDMTFTDQVIPGAATVHSCSAGVSSAPGVGGGPTGGPPVTCFSGGASARVDITGHGTVNLNPYAMVAVSEVSGLGTITTYVNGTTVWELGGGNYGNTAGNSLSGFASLVEGTLGPGEGAVAMIGLASPNGYLNLEQAAVADATQTGTRTVDGTSVTYYDVTIDLTRLADAPDLTDEERVTIHDALPVLTAAGYSGTEERIGVDAAGFIREVTATEHFSDGSATTRHTILSNFGCAPKVYLPNEQPPATTTTVPCTSPVATTTAPSTISTTLAPTTTSSTTSTTPPTTATTSTTSTPTTTSLPPTTRTPHTTTTSS
jgi:hypothetical protein